MSLYVRVKTWVTEVLTRTNVQAEIDAAAVALRNLEDANLDGSLPRSLFEEDGGRGVWIESWCPMSTDGHQGRPHHPAGLEPHDIPDPQLIAHGMGSVSSVLVAVAPWEIVEFPGADGRKPGVAMVLAPSATPRTVEFPPWRPFHTVRLESGRVTVAFYHDTTGGAPFVYGTMNRCEFDLLALPVDWARTASRADMDTALADPNNSILTAPIEFDDIIKGYNDQTGDAFVAGDMEWFTQSVNIGERTSYAFRKADMTRDLRLFPVVRWKVTHNVGPAGVYEAGIRSCAWALNYTTEHVGADSVVP